MNEIAQFSIRQLLGTGDRYMVPMYQRNYAWEEAEISQLIHDLFDSIPEPGTTARAYYIGTLVVYRPKYSADAAFEVMDGQQRLTTLSLLTDCLKQLDPNQFDQLSSIRLEFECRPQSQRTLEAIQGCSTTDITLGGLDPTSTNSAILNGYRLVQNALRLKFADRKIKPATFADFFLDHVQIMRVEVPADTDRNHYFEIMNNRGEQLEKHEVLKSRLLASLERIPDPDERRRAQSCLHQVWEASSNIEQYIQTGFTPEQRNRLFDQKDGQLVASRFEDLCAALAKDEKAASHQGTRQKIRDIIASASPSSPDKNPAPPEAPERFHSIVNFPHFLLHVLRVQSGKNVPLDDKQLLKTFEDHVLVPNKDDQIVHVKHFTVSLLRCKLLYDDYILKREFIGDKNGWSLKRFKWSEGRSQYVNTFGQDSGTMDGTVGENRVILMLLAAFHVSTPTMAYKHWLSASLRYLFSQTLPITATEYLRHLESVAKCFVFDRFLADSPLEYHHMIFGNQGIFQTTRSMIDREAMRRRLAFGHIENFVFNYLDYLLWKNECIERTGEKKDDKIMDFRFTVRSSVEHFYPQNPMNPSDSMADKTLLNSFGNLCLISHGQNSRLSNYLPKAKKEHYEGKPLDSVKQYLMMRVDPWDHRSVRPHEDAMMDVLIKSLDAAPI